jgi:hypothetical protein
MAEIFGINVGFDTPTLGTGSLLTTITYLAIVIILFIVISIGVYLFYMNRLYNKKIIIWENVGEGHYQKTGQDKARLIKIGDGGEEVLYLRGRKVYRTAYGKKMSKNTYWFAVGQDGYWYNIVLGDLDAKMGMLDIEPIDRDMRYMHVALRKNAQERYNKQKFMEKYGTLIINGVFLLIMVVAVWLLVDQVGNLIVEATRTVEAGTQTNDLIIKALAKVDTVSAGGSGITPTT